MSRNEHVAGLTVFVMAVFDQVTQTFRQECAFKANLQKRALPCLPSSGLLLVLVRSCGDFAMAWQQNKYSCRVNENQWRPIMVVTWDELDRVAHSGRGVSSVLSCLVLALGDIPQGFSIAVVDQVLSDPLQTA